MRQIISGELTKSHYFEGIVIHTIGKPNKIVAAEFLAYMLLSAYLRKKGINKTHIDSIVHSYLENINFEEWNL